MNALAAKRRRISRHASPQTSDLGPLYAARRMRPTTFQTHLEDLVFYFRSSIFAFVSVCVFWGQTLQLCTSVKTPKVHAYPRLLLLCVGVEYWHKEESFPFFNSFRFFFFRLLHRRRSAQDFESPLPLLFELGSESFYVPHPG